MQKKPKVLFLSRGNATLSQMAEGFLRAMGGDRFEAASAGLEPGVPNPAAVEVMKEAGIDISGQKAKYVKESLKEHYGYVTHRVRCRSRKGAGVSLHSESRPLEHLRSGVCAAGYRGAREHLPPRARRDSREGGKFSERNDQETAGALEDRRAR